MNIYPIKTGTLCANSHPGSYTGQDAFNDMLPEIGRNTDEMVLRRKRTTASNVYASDNEHAGLYARSANISGGVLNWKRVTNGNTSFADLLRWSAAVCKASRIGGQMMWMDLILLNTKCGETGSHCHVQLMCLAE